MPGFTFERIVILESLTSKDPLMTGYELCMYLKPLLEERQNLISVELVNFSSACDLQKILRNLTSEVLNGGPIPAVHIETHGNSDGTGLVLSDRTAISWGDLGDLCVDLNRATRFNLLLVVAACYSGDFFDSEFRLDKPSPFCGFIAPSEKANGSEMLGSFRTFYRTLLETNDALDAFSRIAESRLDKGNFVVKIAHEVFYAIFDRIFKNKRTPEEIDKMLEKMADKIISRYGYLGKHVGPPFKSIRRQILANSDRDFLARKFETFFMLDSIPENEPRFGDIKNLISKNYFQVE